MEEETKFVPVTVSVNAAPPATAAAGPSDEMAGSGLSIVKFRAADVPPPGAGVVTVTIAIPAVATSAELIEPCRVVDETKVVVRVDPFHCTTEEEIKLDPFTVRVKAADPATAELGLREPFATDGLGFGGGGGALPAPPQPARLKMVIAISAPIAALRSQDGRPNVSNLLPVHCSGNMHWLFTAAPLKGGHCEPVVCSAQATSNATNSVSLLDALTPGKFTGKSSYWNPHGR